MNIRLFDTMIQVDNGIQDPRSDAQLLTVTDVERFHDAEVCIETRTVGRGSGGEVTASIGLDEAGLRALADWLRRRGY